VYVINADGSGRTNLTTRSESDTEIFDADPDWSPEGTRITFLSNRGGSPSAGVYTVNSDDSDVAQVTHAGRGEDITPAWQPLPEDTPPKNRGATVHPPDTGGPSLILVASALLFCGCVIFYAGVNRRT
jgi:hypothetical protein